VIQEPSIGSTFFYITVLHPYTMYTYYNKVLTLKLNGNTLFYSNIAINVTCSYYNNNNYK